METNIRLNDKTVVLVGPFGPIMQNLIPRISESGADVCALTDDVKTAQRVCQNVLDQHEVLEHHGRAAAFELTKLDAKSIEVAFGRAAELFGTTDVLIDLNLLSTKIPFYSNNPPTDEVNKNFSEAFERLSAISKVGVNFVRSRAKGRLIYLFHLLDAWAAEKAKSDVYTNFYSHINKLAFEYRAQSLTVNGISVGVSEEYLLSRFPKSSSIRLAHQELIKTIPHSKMVDFAEIANLTTFIASPLSSGINGQILKIDHAL